MVDYRKKIEQKLKRKLSRTEIVHHKDGDNYNNELSNLQVVSSQIKHNRIPKKKRIISDNDYNSLIVTLQTRNLDSFKAALKTFFTPYQISIIIRKANLLPLSKTDREVFSRVVKKKLIALANEQTYKIANIIIQHA